MCHLIILFKWILFNFKKSQISKDAKQKMLGFYFKLETVLPQLLLLQLLLSLPLQKEHSSEYVLSLNTSQ